MRVRRTTAAAVAAAGITAAVAMVGAPLASAAQPQPIGGAVHPIIWYQGFQRAGADAACVAPADQTPWQDSYQGQKDWTASWAEWANDGKGGWVCERWIWWATQVEPGHMPS